MFSNNIGVYGMKILTELIRDLVFFPIWWYSQGLFLFVKRNWEFLKQQEKSLALFIWIKNIHRPMYGQQDWQGILISVLMRIVQIIIRSVVMLFWIGISLLAILIWVFIPLIIIYQVIFQFSFY